MAGLDVAKIAKEFMEFELDPGKLDVTKVHGELLAIRQTLDLSTTAHCRQANALLASLMQIISFKAARCHYWERILTDQLKMVRLINKRVLTSGSGYVPSAANNAMAEEAAEISEEVKGISEKLTNASAARHFWEHLESMVHDVAKRVDSASASLGVEAKTRSIA